MIVNWAGGSAPRSTTSGVIDWWYGLTGAAASSESDQYTPSMRRRLWKRRRR